MDQVCLALPLCKTSNNGIGCANMVAIRGMDDDVGIGSFFGNQVGTLEVSIDKANLGILSCNLGAFVAVANLPR
jgi:hypothetical protein